MRIKHGHGVSAEEAGDVCQVVDGVEALAEPSNFGGITLLRSSSQFRYILEVFCGEHGVVVHTESGPLQGSHAVRNKLGPGLRVLSLIQQKADFRGPSIIRILDQLLGHREPIRVGILEQAMQPRDEVFSLPIPVVQFFHSCQRASLHFKRTERYSRVLVNVGVDKSDIAVVLIRWGACRDSALLGGFESEHSSLAVVNWQKDAAVTR